MLPTLTDVHIDFALTDFALKWMQDQGNFLASQAFASTGVSHATNKYYTYNREDFWRDRGDDDMLLAPGAPVKRGGYRMSNDSYSCDVRAYGKPVPLEIAKNADGGIDSEQDAIDFVMTQLMVRREAQFVTKYLSTGIWTTDITPSNLWSDFSASDPKSDVETGVLAIESITGKRPNTMLVGARVHSKLKQHPLVKEQYKYTDSESITEAMLAKFFEVDNYIVARAVKATSNEGATAAFDYIVGKHVLLCYRGPDGGGDTRQGATAGRIFNWNGYGNDAGIAISSYFENQTRSTILEGFMAFDFKKVSADLGYFFNGAVT